jgi:hypothetical protein
MANQHEPWRQRESSRGEYPRREQQERDDRYRSTYRHGGPSAGYRGGSREDRGGAQRYEFENDAYGQGYWPAGYENDWGPYGPSESYGREDEGYGNPSQYSAHESGRFRGVSRGRPRQSMYGAGSAWTSESGMTGESRGPHRGKGPKGYTRSDERLKEIVSERLMDDPDIDASDITIEVAGQTVTLSGTVESRPIKYQVEELIENCGVEDVVNNLRIRRAGQGSDMDESDISTSSRSQTSRGTVGSQSTSGDNKTGGDKTSRRGY